MGAATSSWNSSMQDSFQPRTHRNSPTVSEIERRIRADLTRRYVFQHHRRAAILLLPAALLWWLALPLAGETPFQLTLVLASLCSLVLHRGGLSGAGASLFVLAMFGVAVAVGVSEGLLASNASPLQLPVGVAWIHRKSFLPRATALITRGLWLCLAGGLPIAYGTWAALSQPGFVGSLPEVRTNGLCLACVWFESRADRACTWLMSVA